MLILTDKTILIVSPQPWGKMRISKHHYAIELSKTNKVYFLNPPDRELRDNIEITGTGYPSLKQVTYKPFFNTSLRFHARWFFNLLMRIQVKRIVNFIQEELDIVWCYELNLYSNLTWFKAKRIIYHPVDLISYHYQIHPARKADFIFSVSDTILTKLKNIEKPKALVNHGLSKEFANLALKRLGLENYMAPSRIKIGYIGNLLIHSIDLKLILDLVHHYPQFEFHFWGSYKNDESLYIEGNAQIEKLKDSDNVILHGLCLPEEITQQIEEIDIFILAYLITKGNYDRSNSHKILEYMSSGKVIVSTPLLHYSNMSDLIQMSTAEDNSDFMPLFEKTVNNLNYYNSIAMQKKRIQFALENTYEKQLTFIDSFINTHETKPKPHYTLRENN